MTMHLHEIIRFQEFLKDKESLISTRLESNLGIKPNNTILQAAVKLVFEVINQELEVEFREADQKMFNYFKKESK
jgi:hypothetical protein